MFHKCLKPTIHGPFPHQNGRSLYMIISQLNDSLCFNEVISWGFFFFSCGKVSTSECNLLYIFLKKKGPPYWRSDHSHCPEQSLETLFSQCLTFITPDSLESTMLQPNVSPPPQRTTVPSGSMLNQHVDFSLTCVWTRGLHWEYCLTSPFFSRKRACGAGLYCTR